MVLSITKINMHSQFLWCSPVRGSDSWVCPRGPTKVGAHKSMLFTESSHVVEIKNTWLISVSHSIQNTQLKTQGLETGCKPFLLDIEHVYSGYNFSSSGI